MTKCKCRNNNNALIQTNWYCLYGSFASVVMLLVKSAWIRDNKSFKRTSLHMILYLPRSILAFSIIIYCIYGPIYLDTFCPKSFLTLSNLVKIKFHLNTHIYTTLVISWGLEAHIHSQTILETLLHTHHMELIFHFDRYFSIAYHSHSSLAFQPSYFNFMCYISIYGVILLEVCTKIFELSPFQHHNFT